VCFRCQDFSMDSRSQGNKWQVIGCGAEGDRWLVARGDKIILCIYISLAYILASVCGPLIWEKSPVTFHPLPVNPHLLPMEESSPATVLVVPWPGNFQQMTSLSSHSTWSILLDERPWNSFALYCRSEVRAKEWLHAKAIPCTSFLN